MGLGVGPDCRSPSNQSKQPEHQSRSRDGRGGCTGPSRRGCRPGCRVVRAARVRERVGSPVRAGSSLVRTNSSGRRPTVHLRAQGRRPSRHVDLPLRQQHRRRVGRAPDRNLDRRSATGHRLQGNNPNSGLAGGEAFQVSWVMGQDQSPAEANRSGYHKSVDRQVAARTDRSQQWPATRAMRTPVVMTLAYPRPSSRSMASSLPPPRYNSTSVAAGTRTGSRRRWAERMAARTRSWRRGADRGRARADKASLSRIRATGSRSPPRGPPARGRTPRRGHRGSP